MKITVDDAPIVGLKQSPTARRLTQFLTCLPDGRLLTGRKLCGETQANYRGLAHYTPEIPEALRERQIGTHGTRWLFGNPRTIAAYRASLTHETKPQARSSRPPPTRSTHH